MHACRQWKLHKWQLVDIIVLQVINWYTEYDYIIATYNEAVTYYASLPSQPELVRKRNVLKHRTICSSNPSCHGCKDQRQGLENVRTPIRYETARAQARRFAELLEGSRKETDRKMLEGCDSNNDNVSVGVKCHKAAGTEPWARYPECSIELYTNFPSSATSSLVTCKEVIDLNPEDRV